MPSQNEVVPKKIPTIIRIDINDQGSIIWNGQEISRNKFITNLDQVSTESDNTEFHIKPSKKAHYKFLVAILSDLQNKGLKNVAITGNERFVQD
jgi:biopolymer transport protein ExbD